MPVRRGTKRGFTLIELSIILVIVGLIVGGVLAGRNLIANAEMRAVVTQIEKLKTAVITFKTKYDALPGDMANATSFWPADPNCGSRSFTAADTCNGNGDGVIGGSSFSNPGSVWLNQFSEVFGVWNQLALARLIPGAYANGPVCSVPGMASPTPVMDYCAYDSTPNVPLIYGSAGVELMYADNGIGGTVAGATNARHTFVVAQATGSVAPYGASNGNAGGRVFTSSQAYAIDQKMDDGLPYTGNVLGTFDLYYDACGRSDSGANVYTMGNGLAQGYPSTPAGCALFFNAGF